MPVFRPEDLSEAGAGASNLLQGLASTIANNVCSLYQNAPRGFVGSNPVSDAVNSFNSGFWDDFCGSLPEPKVPASPVAPPAQCSGKSYKCVVSYTRKSSDGTETAISYETYRCGPISYTLRAMTEVTFGQQEALWTTTGSSSSSSGDCTAGEPTSAIFDNFIKPGTYQVQFSRVDGQADDCGQPSYPDVSPPVQNPGIHTYTGNDGVTRAINYSIDFDPTINGPLVRLPDIPNVCVGFGFSGIEIDLCTNKPGTGTGGDISEIEDKIDALRDILDRLEEDSKENLNKEDTDDNPPEQTDPENEPPDGGISKCVPNLRFVKVTLTNIPPNANVEVGQAGFDRIDDAGWLTFTKDGFFFPPQRIEFGGAIFEAPPGVECFTMQLRFGFAAVVTTVVKDS